MDTSEERGYCEAETLQTPNTSGSKQNWRLLSFFFATSIATEPLRKQWETTECN